MIRRIVILSIIVSFHFFSGCKKQEAPASSDDTADRNRPNLIVISLDTLRSDRLGCYGYDLPTSPFMNSLSKRSVLLTDVLAQNPATILSHRAIFTGLYVYLQPAGPAAPSVTMAGRLADAGYETAAFTDGGLMNARFGNNPGFQVYNDDAGGAAMVFRRGLDWLDGRLLTKAADGSGNQPDKPFFLFLHTYDVHYPYIPAVPFDNMFLPGPDPPYHLGSDHGQGYWNKLSLERDEFIWISRRYDGGIRSVDRKLQNLWAGLLDRKLADRTILIILSDHGESLGERLYVGHHEMYDVQLQVPVIIRAPKWDPFLLDGAFESIDILPTVMDILSLPNDNALPGRSVVEAVRKRVNPGPMRPRLSESWAKAFRLGTEWKFILRATEEEDELYRRDSDPEEMHNLAAENPDIAGDLRQALAGYTGGTAETVRRGRRQREMPVLLMAKDGHGDQDKLMNQLRELGYMQ